jgi:PAS domain S-box-containing protein
MTGACTDLMHARLTREKLEHSEASLRALLEALPVGMSAFDAHGTLLYFNAKSLDLRGLTSEEVEAGQYSVTPHPEDQSRVLAGWHEAVRAGRPWSDTYRYLHPRDGKCVWVDARTAPIRVKGRLMGFVETAADITWTREAEAERERLLRREREAREHAQWAAQARQEMVALVAHDLRNPLHVVASGASVLQDPTLAPERRQKLAAIVQRNARLMSRLLDDLLDFSRIEAGRFAVRRGAVDMMRVLEEMLESFQASARERGVSLELVDGATIGPVSADRDRILQALSNLVGNALKFTNAGGHVEVLAEDRGDRVELAVRDDGIGMEPRQLAHLFERYWKAEPESRSGAGLGLAIVKGIVEAHGGSIRAESKPGRGTSVRFTIPR